MDIRRAVRAVGRTLIAAGVLILLFVAYQLWGTGLAEARSQDKLTEQFQRRLATPPPTTPQSRPTDPESVPPPAPAGEAIAILKIPKLGVEKAVIEGVGLPDLKKGPGHYPGTPLPGQEGNSAIAGHRTTYGAPFFRLDELKVGDSILVTTRQGEFKYEVAESKIVAPTEVSVIANTPGHRLTLTTCNPRYSAKERLIIMANLAANSRKDPTPPALGPPPDETVTSDPAGLSGGSSSNGPAIAWGAAAAAVWFLAWWAGRRWRRLPAYLLGTPVFLVVLFFFFENFSRLLPSNF